MNTHDEERGDHLLDEYRRAGDAQAGRPSDSTRKAILEGSRAEAQARQPAANDSRFKWSAAAGIAVLGVALLLWRQTDTRLVATAPSSPGVSGATPAVVAEARSEAAEPERSREVTAVADAAVSKASQRPLDESAQRLRDRFPEAWESTSPPAMVWIVEDARGLALRQGTLAAGESLPDLQVATPSQSARSTSVGAVASESVDTLGAESTGWTLQTTVNSAGIPVQVATARDSGTLPAEAPAPAASDR